MAREPIHAAGGIVLRGGARPRFAVVRRSKDDRWVLPRGKLKRDENPIAGAKREVLEETGHRVKKVHEFLGAITYSARGRPKVVQFWRMRAAEQPTHELTEDITEVIWLPLAAAVRRLSFPLEKLFLRNVGRRALKPRHRRKHRRKAARRPAHARKARASPRKKKTAVRRPRKKPRSRRTAPRKISQATPHRVTPTLAVRATLPPAPRPFPHVIPPVAPQPSLDTGFFRRILGRN
jgi:8-oxo-dGTP diphosphatase